jgi:hypothetical protein
LDTIIVKYLGPMIAMISTEDADGDSTLTGGASTLGILHNTSNSALERNHINRARYAILRGRCRIDIQSVAPVVYHKEYPVGAC